MKALLLSKDKPAALPQIFPFHLYREELRQGLGFQFEEWSLDSPADIDLGRLDRFDVVFIQAKFIRQNVSALSALFLGAIKVKKVFLDDGDCPGRCFFNTEPLIDLYVKKQVLRDFDDYRFVYPEERFHAHYINCPDGELTPHRRDIPHSFRAKLLIGWNVGVAEWLHQSLLRDGDDAPRGRTQRPIDISMRISTARGRQARQRDCPAGADWYGRHRRNALDALTSLSDSFSVVASGDQFAVGRDQYHRELRESKIALSPWGVGEVCYGDFEAILAGALLIGLPWSIWRPTRTSTSLGRPTFPFDQILPTCERSAATTSTMRTSDCR